MKFTQKNLKTCFYVNVHVILPLFSSFSADQSSTIRKEQQILRGGNSIKMTNTQMQQIPK